MPTLVWWMRWQERDDEVEVVTCREHTRTLLAGPPGTEFGARTLSHGNGRCELCVAHVEAETDIRTFPEIPEPVLL